MKAGYKDKITFRPGNGIFIKGNINASTYIPPPPPPQFIETLSVFYIPVYVDGIQAEAYNQTFAFYAETYNITPFTAYSYLDGMSGTSSSIYRGLYSETYNITPFTAYSYLDGMSGTSSSIYRGLYSETYAISN